MVTEMNKLVMVVHALLKKGESFAPEMIHARAAKGGDPASSLEAYLSGRGCRFHLWGANDYPVA